MAQERKLRVGSKQVTHLLGNAERELAKPERNTFISVSCFLKRLLSFIIPMLKQVKTVAATEEDRGCFNSGWFQWLSAAPLAVAIPTTKSLLCRHPAAKCDRCYCLHCANEGVVQRGRCAMFYAFVTSAISILPFFNAQDMKNVLLLIYDYCQC